MIRYYLNNFIVCFTVILSAGAAHAADETGRIDGAASASAEYYLSLGAGLTIAPDQRYVVPNHGSFFDLGSKSGAVITAAMGFDGWSDGLRTEIEVSHRYNQLDDYFFVPGDGNINSYGSLSATSVMANALVDTAITPDLTLYVGAGVGASVINMNFRRSDGGFRYILASGQYATFAYQGLVGADFRITDKTSVFAQYQYLNTVERKHVGFHNTSNGTIRLNSRYDSHTAAVGFRIKLD